MQKKTKKQKISHLCMNQKGKKKPSRRNESNSTEDSPTFQIFACVTLAKHLITINGFSFLRAAYHERILK